MDDMMGSRHCIWRFIPRVRVGKGERPMEGNRHWRKRTDRMARMDRERDCDGRYCIAEQASHDRWLFGHLANLQRSIVALNQRQNSLCFLCWLHFERIAGSDLDMHMPSYFKVVLGL